MYHAAASGCAAPYSTDPLHAVARLPNLNGDAYTEEAYMTAGLTQLIQRHSY